ncbi:MAG: DinB family protein [Anaerolineales bacterium]|nr:DinB family protein [Anaerolineales bacterium]
MAYDPTATSTTAQVLDRIQAARQALEAELAGLDEAALTRPGPDGGWSIKDHLAHLTAWRRMVLGMLAGQPRHVALQVEAATYAQGEDAINVALAARSNSQPLAEVLSQFRQVYDELTAQLAGFDEATWHQPYPLTPRPKDGRLGNIEGNTFEHDREHLGYIQQLLQQRA